MRIHPQAFEALDLRVHSLLHDVPLHDVWRIELAPRQAPVDMEGVRRIYSAQLSSSLNPVVRGLFALRSFLGRVFGWDVERPEARTQSFQNRLTEQDRARSTVVPGTPEGPFRVLYAFESEAVAEAINKTVHAFSCLALEPHDGGYFLYWAIYVRPGGVLTTMYMALIDPFRRWLVYPSVIRRLQRAWAANAF